MTLFPLDINDTVSVIFTGHQKSDTQQFASWLSKGDQTLQLNQKHTDRTIIWDQNSSLSDLRPPADGVLTALPNISLTLRTADCLPILLIHTVQKIIGDNHSVLAPNIKTQASIVEENTAGDNPSLSSNEVVIGAVHAGRKGTQDQILKKALQLLQKTWGSGQTRIWFGPHICSRCYEVDRSSHDCYNLREKNMSQVESTLPPKSYHIIDSEHCTYEGDSEWFSYRREGKAAGRNLCGIRIRNTTRKTN